MNILSEAIQNELSQRTKYVVPVVEFYTRDTEDIVSTAAPLGAVAKFSNECYSWVTSEGTHEYDGKVKEFPEIELFLDERINNAEITFLNIERGARSMSRFVLDNHVKGMWMVIRLIFPNSPDTSYVVFWGKCQRPGGISNEELTIRAEQDLGNYKQEIPFRNYMVNCPLEFAIPGGGCLGNETLEQKNLAFRQAFADFSTAGCNKIFSTCNAFGNTRFFQGQRVVAVSGQFSYVTIEEVIKRVLFWTKRKKVRVVKTDNWSSMNQSEGNEIIPIAFGRCQIEGHPFTWADTGTQVQALYGFCEGKISAFSFIRSRTEGINLVNTIEHLGDWGNEGTQTLDTLFNGTSGYNSRLAYIEASSDGSQPTQVDDAPIITAVIRGLEIPTPDLNGEFLTNEWTCNPAYIMRFLLTDVRFGRIPLSRIDDDEVLITAADCEELVEDLTNEETIIFPSNVAGSYGIDFRRFRSTGRHTAYRDMYYRGELPVGSEYPEFDDPLISWFNPYDPYPLRPSYSVLRLKYTCNGALQEQTSILDFVNEQILPTFKGYLNYGANGKIQIKNRRKADNAYTREDTIAGISKIPITNVKPWRNGLDGYLIIGVSLEQAEVRQVTAFEYSTACNGVPITAVVVGTGLTVTTSNITGGTARFPGLGYIQINGTPANGEGIEISFESGEDLFTVAYYTDGTDDLDTFCRMFTAFCNANVLFSSSYSAFINPDNTSKIWIQCESGYLNLNNSLEYDHTHGEEVMRVMAVFENCGELTANQSAQFDNIRENSFKWNDEDQDEVNALTATYTSAVDDFFLAQLMPRAAWDTIDIEGEITKEDIDLTFVDNYWQAAYLTKGMAIDRIDGNLFFSWETGMDALGLEVGDVITIRHDSGDGALNYVPVWITEISLKLDNFTISIKAKLYLSAAFDYHVQPIEPRLPTVLNPAEFPIENPPTTGGGGGVGNPHFPFIEPPVTVFLNASYYESLGVPGKYSPTGKDII